MFRHLLVPLDGSRLAESALPPALALARRLGARLTLFHAVERGAAATVHGERHLTDPTEAEVYLRTVAARCTAAGVQADPVVHRDGAEVAHDIAEGAARAGADLIVLCTHGRSGLRGLLSGRVAQRVLQSGTVPVFLVRPAAAAPGEVGEAGEAFVCRRLLVPLDGSETAEAALVPAAALARAFGADLVLAWVVPTVATVADDRAPATLLMPTAAAALLDAEAAQAAGYLDRLSAGLRQSGLPVAAAVERGEVVRVLLDLATQRAIDLIVIATHGRSGVAAVWAGSVASRMLAHSTPPVLLVRIPPSA